jgi:hypothetical protein
MALFGAFLRGSFGLPKADKAAIERIKDLSRSVFQGHPDTAFAVNEIACNDPGCPGIETVILVMEPGAKTRACKVQKPLNDVTEQDLRHALEVQGG